MKMLKVVFTMLILIVAYILFSGEGIAVSGSYRDVSPTQARKMIDRYQDLVVIDISGTYHMGHIPGSVNYYIGDGSLQEALPELDKHARYLIYYHNNATSKKAAEMFTSAGFRKVYRLEGNFSSWVEAGYETASL